MIVLLIVLLILPPVQISAAPMEEINFLFGGDVTLGGHYPLIAPSAFTDFGWPFEKLQPLFAEMDVVMVNCENAITDSAAKVPKKFNFKMDARLVPVFKQAGITLVSLANNHVYDYGLKGLVDTIKHLMANSIDYVGAGRNLAEARKPVVKNIKGKKIVFLAYGNYSPATKTSPGAAYRNPLHVIEDVAMANANGADIIVVNFHWGEENAPLPTARDQKLARMTIDAGADIVIGHHPHVVQPIEVYKGKIIAYSLGNFIFGGNRRGGKNSILLKVAAKENGDLIYEAINIRIDPQETRYQPYIIKQTTKK